MLRARGGFLPSAQVRWCTEHLKIKPFEEYIGDDLCYSYVGIRADEQHRKGYISTKPNIVARYPFIEDDIGKGDVIRILEESGLGMPSYYAWRSRSGCYFCFFQQRNEWGGLLENHPTLYDRAAAYEKEDPKTGERFTWSSRESLTELRRPERVDQIKAEHKLREQAKTKHQANRPLALVFRQDNAEDEGCLICHL